MNEENVSSTVEDYEVRRLWTMLTDLENNSMRAKKNLRKFQAELDRIMPPSSPSVSVGREKENNRSPYFSDLEGSQ